MVDETQDAQIDDGMIDTAALAIEDAVNETCPWSGKPISADALTLYKGFVVGFCNPGCRDKFDDATRHFDAAIAAYEPDEPDDELPDDLDELAE